MLHRVDPCCIPPCAGGWDKTVRYWDLNQGKCIGTLNMPEKVYAMDYREHTLIVATAEEPAANCASLQKPGAAQTGKQNTDKARRVRFRVRPGARAGVVIVCMQGALRMCMPAVRTCMCPVPMTVLW